MTSAGSASDVVDRDGDRLSFELGAVVFFMSYLSVLLAVEFQNSHSSESSMLT